MPKVSSRTALLAGSADDVEAAFYEALQTGNIEQLMACWAHEDEVVCVHPGGPRLVGTGAIRAAFESMFANGTIQVHAHSVRKIESLTSVVHNVVERVELLLPDGPKHASVVATNVYHRTPQGWRIVAHHASPGTPQELQEGQDAPQVLH